MSKKYNPGIRVNCLITHDDETSESTEFGSNVYQNISCAFHRETLKEKDYNPSIGDIIQWNSFYYEISNITDNQLLAGRDTIKHSLICAATLTNLSALNMRGTL